MKLLIYAFVSLVSMLSFQLQAQTTLAELVSDTGDTLMVHRLNDGELWGSFVITDQVSDSFDDDELIVLQVDNNKPITLEHQKLCGGGKGDEQQISFEFTRNDDDSQWLFSQANHNKVDVLKLTGWDQETYHHMRADRRPEVVDFPLRGELAVDSLWQQFKQGETVVFRYITESGEVRQAKFNLGHLKNTF